MSETLPARLPVFDLEGPLPWGNLAIEASAGTGKTYTLCQLAVRYIAEADIAASSLLIVTFTRAATAELRGRIRESIIERAEALRSTSIDALAPDAARQLNNLERALTEYDAITITTIHSFATQTMGSMGATSRFDPPRGFTTDSADMVRSACSDAILQAAVAGTEQSLLPDHKDLVAAVKIALTTPDISVEPPETDGELTDAAVLASLVRKVLLMLATRRRRRGEVSFDDVLTGLREMVASPEGSIVVESLRERYRVVMIDEFQDTDPVQWAIFGSVFSNPSDRQASDRSRAEPTKRATILVGDPKQSIYSFRGADIATYRAATSLHGTARAALGTNWRSDGQLLAGLEALLSGTTYGESIGFVPVKAAPANIDRHARHGDAPIAPVRVRLALGDEIKRTKKGGIESSSAQRAIWNDLVQEVHNTLNAVTFPTRDGAFRRAEPSDIAVLVNSGWEAETVQEMLIRSGVPAVLSRAGRVLRSPAAEQWRWLLDTLARPSDPLRARRFALSWFSDVDLHTLDQNDDATMIAIFERLRSWLDLLRQRGVAEFVQRVYDESAVLPRMLRRVDGDRAVTDLLHIGELLQTETRDHRPTIGALLAVLQAQDSDAGIDEADEYSRRVETEDSAVQIMTIWVSKGLEFPVVMAPTLYCGRKDGPPVVFTDASGRRIFDVSGKTAEPESVESANAREIEERLRLLYVALTRGSHQVTAWWANARYAGKSPLSRVLFARDDSGEIDAEKYASKSLRVPRDASGAELLNSIVSASEDRVQVTVIDDPGLPLRRWAPSTNCADSDRTSADLTLDAAELTRPLPRTTGRWSFTAITATEIATAVEPDASAPEAGSDDEFQTVDLVPDPTRSPIQAEVQPDTGSIPLGWLPAGASFGTLVHSIYEHLDFTDSDVEASARKLICEEGLWRAVDLTPPLLTDRSDTDGVDLLAKGIALSVETPLGTMFGDRTLSSIPRSDRLDELSFELLLGAERSDDNRATPFTDRELGAVIARWIDDDSPLTSWVSSLEKGRFGVDLAGHLTGSIDLVTRIQHGQHSRFVVIDYKTNRLSGYKEIPEPGHYDVASMTEAMIHHHYLLQALLYSVALHRYLRSRLPDYDPEVHLGGVAYLFVRGMVGKEALRSDGTTSGVWTWLPPSGLILELSDVLAGISRDEGWS